MMSSLPFEKFEIGVPTRLIVTREDHMAVQHEGWLFFNLMIVKTFYAVR